MKFLRTVYLSLLLFFVSSSTLAQASGPDARQISDPKSVVSASNPVARPIPFDDLYFTRSVSSASWSPDGKEIVFTTDISGRSNLWKVNADGGWPIQLSQSDERQYGETWSPDGKWIVFQQDTAGNELWDIFAIPSDGGEVINLTNTPEIREESPRWSPDGKTIALNYKPQKATVYNIELMDWGTRKVTPLTHETTANHLWQSVAWSPDGKTLYANRLEVSFTDADVYAIDIASGNATNLTPHQGQVLSTASSLSKDGKTLLITSNEKGGYQNIALLDIVEKKLTYSAIASLNSAPRPPSQIVSYKSLGGKTISALMWIPFNLKRDASNPALVLPHGGPTGQSGDYWSPRIAAFVSRGYICIAPNVRGSTGYGIEFQKANYKDLGGGDLQDEVFAAKFLEATGYVNPKKIGITGGSYGGFMTLMALGRSPEVWAAGVELFGIINWMTMLQHEDPMLQEYEKSLLGDPLKDRATYDAASPITYIHNVKAPLLVLQGDNDPRVPREEAEQVVELLKKDGKTVDAHYYANEGHGFEKRENQIDSIRRTVEWFDKYLKGNN